MVREPAGCGAFPRNLRRAVQLFDSKVLELTQTENSLRIVLDAYVHVSPGEPGADPGTAWSQRVVLLLGEARLVARPAGLPLWLTGGRLCAAGAEAELLALPLQQRGPLTLLLVGEEGRLEAEGSSLTLDAEGDPTFVERFAGAAAAPRRPGGA